MQQNEIPKPDSISHTKEYKPVFKITTYPPEICAKLISENAAPNKDCTWTLAEHLRFIDSLKKHGKSWPLIHEDLLIKTSMQICTHATNFLLKVGSFEQNQDPLEFIRSKPTEYFAENLLPKSIIDLNKSLSKKHESTWPGISSTLKKKHIESDIPKDPSLTETMKNYSNAVEFIMGSSRKALASGQKKKPFLSKKSLNLCFVEPKKQNNKLEDEKKQNQNEEDRKTPAPSTFGTDIIKSNVAMEDKLFHMLKQLTELSDRLNIETPTVRNIMGGDLGFDYYWNSLMSCSLSLQNIVNDVAYIHMAIENSKTQMQVPSFYQPNQQPRPYFGQNNWPLPKYS